MRAKPKVLFSCLIIKGSAIDQSALSSEGEATNVFVEATQQHLGFLIVRRKERTNGLLQWSTHILDVMPLVIGALHAAPTTTIISFESC